MRGLLFVFIGAAIIVLPDIPCQSLLARCARVKVGNTEGTEEKMRTQRRA